jgi:hypothetical protein
VYCPVAAIGFQKKLELLVPSVVVDEFERNRPRAEAAVTSSALERFSNGDKTCRNMVVTSDYSGLKRCRIEVQW